MTAPLDDAIKWGPVVPLRMENGKPQCPHGCGDMVQQANGLWGCPIGLAQQDHILRWVRESFEALDLTAFFGDEQGAGDPS